MIKEKLQTIPGGVPNNTHMGRVGGQMPPKPATPSGQELPHLNGGPAGSSPLDNGSDSQGLPMFSPTAGYSDTGAQGH